METLNMTITETAQQYLKQLIEKQDGAIGVKLAVVHGGTPKAETLLTYAREETSTKTVMEHFGELPVYVDRSSVQWLDEAFINYDTDKYGGAMTIKAPNSKLPKLTENSTLEERVNYHLWNDVYPMVAPHGGEVNLVELTDDNIAVLQFGGGCQGCSAVDITLKQGVEKTLLESIPELAGVRDITDHTDKSSAFYK
jgi:Fe/S biogenesis protein NfuA